VSEAADPAVAFERQWAESVLARALAGTREYLTRTGQSRIWEVFDRRIVRPMTEGVAAVPYDDLVREFNFETPLQAANVLTTAKRVVDRELRRLLSEEAADDASIDAELGEFLRIFDIATGSFAGRRK
jgi:hypothetical protein